MKQIKLLEGCTQDSINSMLKKLQQKDYEILDVKVTPETYKHYVTYCTIVYEDNK